MLTDHILRAKTIFDWWPGYAAAVAAAEASIKYSPPYRDAVRDYYTAKDDDLLGARKVRQLEETGFTYDAKVLAETADRSWVHRCVALVRRIEEEAVLARMSSTGCHGRLVKFAWDRVRRDGLSAALADEVRAMARSYGIVGA